MTISALAMCSRALLKLGCPSIAAFDEGTAEAEVAGNLYENIRDALLSAHPWSFATGQIVLARLSAPPVADYQYVYQLPSDFLRALSVGSGADYRIAEQRLHTDASEVVLSYIFRPAEKFFPPFFDNALITRLAAEFCIPLTESTTRSEVLFKLADAEMKRAKVMDSQNAVTDTRILSELHLNPDYTGHPGKVYGARHADGGEYASLFELSSPLEAALVVRACNSHDELVDALVAAAEALETTADWLGDKAGYGGTAQGIRNDAKAARAAISNAKVGT